MKRHLTTIIIALVLAAGLSLMLYPTVSDHINSLHQSKAISTYTESVEKLDGKQYEGILAEALEYNAELSEHPLGFRLTEEENERYSRMLDLDKNGVMGYIEIPSINVSLPIHHGTDDSVLQTAVGHLEWSSLPVGGESSHCVLSGHRGLSSAKLFTNLDRLTEGDLFTLRVLDETLTYEVDQILIVEPKEVNELRIVGGMDYCTLVTCTPYGINTHRLLVRGHRVDTPEETRAVFVPADAAQIKPAIVAPVLAVPILLLMITALLIPKKKNKEDKS